MQWSKVVKTVLGVRGGQVAILLLAVAGVYLFGYRGMRFFLVPSASMEPTLYNMDYIVTLRHKAYRPGDVVVLRDPSDPTAYVVKRIVATGGDIVTIAGGALNLNGAYVSEPYVLELPEYELGPIQIAEGEVFVLGDNRNDSEDGHLWEDPDRSVTEIVGKVRFIYFPYHRAGTLDSYPTARPTDADSGRVAADVALRRARGSTARPGREEKRRAIVVDCM